MKVPLCANSIFAQIRKTYNVQYKRYYNYAITRSIDDTLATSALTMNSDKRSTLDISAANKQHNHLTKLLELCSVKLHNIDSGGHPDSVFIEDTMIAIDGTVLLTNPGAQSRQKEIIAVRQYLQENEPFKSRMNLVELGNGTLDGGDVLYTGKDILVGISSRSNKDGVLSLQAAFPSIPVIPISLHELTTMAKYLTEQIVTQSNNPASSHSSVSRDWLRQHQVFDSFIDSKSSDSMLHLKSFCSMAGKNRLVVGNAFGAALYLWILTNVEGINDNDAALEVMYSDISHLLGQSSTDNKMLPNRKYEVVLLPDAGAANCLVINNRIIRRTDKEFPNSAKIWRLVEQRLISETGICEPGAVMQAENSELEKVDGALTCCSVLFNVP